MSASNLKEGQGHLPSIQRPSQHVQRPLEKRINLLEPKSGSFGYEEVRIHKSQHTESIKEHKGSPLIQPR